MEDPEDDGDEQLSNAYPASDEVLMVGGGQTADKAQQRRNKTISNRQTQQD